MHLQLSDQTAANARGVGSGQIDAFASHSHQINTSLTGQTGNLATVFSGAGISNTWAAGGTETRPVNTAFSPMICL